jgi:lipopolysaccharide export LptBFGC system permease protein LptF
LIQLNKNQIIKQIFISIFSALVMLNSIVFISHFNLHHSIIWKSDADVKNALQIIENLNNKKGSKTLGISWTLEPSVNYYRETKSLSWLKPVNRDGISGVYDYYLFFDEDSNQLKQQNTISIKRFTENKLTLKQSK